MIAISPSSPRSRGSHETQSSLSTIRARRARALRLRHEKSHRASFQPQVINLPNDFGLQVSALDAVSQDVQYTWQNDGSATSVISRRRI